MLEDIWRALGEAPTEGTGRVERRVDVGVGKDAFLSVSKPANARAFSVATEGALAPGSVETPAVMGFDIHVVDLEGVITITIRLNDPRFSGVFSVLVGDLIDTVRPAEPGETTIKAALSRLNRWERFLQRAGPAGLSWERARGLYGELRFLREHLIGPLGAAVSCRAWVGPEGSAQDFQLAGCAVEVKTTGTKQPQRLRIASERQLDEVGIRRLFVFYLSVDVRHGSGETLPQIVDDLRRICDRDHVRETLEDKLISAGYSDAHRHVYESNGYTPRDSAAFAVTDDFPRIVERDLRDGVGDVRYSVGVAQCRRFEVPQEDFEAAIRERPHA